MSTRVFPGPPGNTQMFTTELTKNMAGEFKVMNMLYHENKTKVISNGLLDFNFDFEDIIVQLHFSFGYISVLVTFQF